MIDSNPAFDLTHEKSMVVDDTDAFVKSLNWETQQPDRDPRLRRRHHAQARGGRGGRSASTPTGSRKEFKPATHSHLIWCIGNGRQRIGQFIDEAKHSLWVQNERYQDPVIIERLVRANRRGVKVHVMARPPHKLKKEKLVEGVGGLRILDDVGINVHKLKGLKLHAKLLLADDQSAPSSAPSISRPAASTAAASWPSRWTTTHIVKRLHEMVRQDWDNSKKLDLTDEGLLAELESVDKNVASDLALDDHKKD